MRHRASLIVEMEGICRPAFRIARELAQNSRSGLTVRFLSKKLELPEEEIEYLVDVHHRFLFTDLTKVKLVPEGVSAVKRIMNGLEHRGDVPSLFRAVKQLSPHDFRGLEEQVGIEVPGAKKAAVEALLETHYASPDAVVTYVAKRGFSETARDLFDIVWQSGDGMMPVPMVRAEDGGSEYDVEQALWELFRGFALFEMFRFNSEDRLIRLASLLAEVRQWRESTSDDDSRACELAPVRSEPANVSDRQLFTSEQVARLVAAIAARPARLRNDGDLFREDHRRLLAVHGEEGEPSLGTCLWVAEGAGWLVRVDNELRAGDLEYLLDMSRLQRHLTLYEWLLARPNERGSRRALLERLEDLEAGAWYPVTEFVDHAMRDRGEGSAGILKHAGGHWRYVSPSTLASSEKGIARSLEEAFHWMGVVARAEAQGEPVFRVTELGKAMLTGEGLDAFEAAFPTRGSAVVVQPNFDVVVPAQEMDPLLTVPLEQFAERASTGHAMVYTVSKERFTQAVQDGHDPNAFVEFLVAHSAEGKLPANVLQTLEDWRGGMKRVRLRTVHIVESDDPLVMADLMHRKRYANRLQAIDPRKTAAYKGITRKNLTKELEKDGFVVD